MAKENDRIAERILRAKRDFERIKGYKPERVLIHYEGWHEILLDKGSEYLVHTGMGPTLQFAGMTAIRTADIEKAEFFVF